MSVWVSIEHAPKDGTPVDLWATNTRDPDPKAAGILLPCLWQRHTDCFWGTPERVKITPSGLRAVTFLPVGWYRTVVGYESTYQMRVWPSHYMDTTEIRKGPAR